MTGARDGQISWAIYLLANVASGFVAIALTSFQSTGIFTGGARFWLALVVGSLLGAIFNWLRPRYERTTRRWRAVYDFLLRQAPPPD